MNNNTVLAWPRLRRPNDQPLPVAAPGVPRIPKSSEWGNAVYHGP